MMGKPASCLKVPEVEGIAKIETSLGNTEK